MMEGEPMMMGAGGKTKLKFKAVKSGCSGKIMLTYVGPGQVADWSKVPADQLKTVNIEVVGPETKMSNMVTYDFIDNKIDPDDNGVF